MLIKGNADISISPASQLFSGANKMNNQKQLILFDGRSICFNPYEGSRGRENGQQDSRD